MSTFPVQNIGSGPHDPDPPPPPDAILQAIRDGATLDGTGSLGGRWLHVSRAGWELRDWRDAAHGCSLTSATFAALKHVAGGAPLAALGQRLGLVPRTVHGQLRAELVICEPGAAGPT